MSGGEDRAGEKGWVSGAVPPLHSAEVSSGSFVRGKRRASAF